MTTAEVLAIELQPWAQRTFERSYREREQLLGRARTSKTDYRAGYIAALRDARVRSAFLHPEEVGL